jgi:beta-lactamase class C
MHEHGTPGMIIALARGSSVPEHLVVGVDGARTPLSADALFPIASITKLATALAALRLVAAGELALDDALASYLPDAAAAREGVTIRTLLCHTAGLPGDVAPGSAPYTADLDWPALARACLQTPQQAPAGTRVGYSNLSSGLLAVVVERVTGQVFRSAVPELVLDPLGIEGYLGTEPPRPPAWLAGDMGEHTGTELEPYNSAFWRTLALPWGGLVTTAVGALDLARAFAGHPAGFLPPSLLEEATRDQTGGLGGGFIGFMEWPRCPWGLGPELRGDKHPSFAPREASPASFGHGGASGCLAYVDPVAGVAWSMLGAPSNPRLWGTWPEIGRAVLATAAG